MNWLELGTFKLHSGDTSLFKIECDNLTDEEVDAFGKIIATNISFRNVIGIPTGGLRLQDAVFKHGKLYSDRVLIVDDVYTTGYSMEEKRVLLAKSGVPFQNIVGAVMFARNPTPSWITPVFQMKCFI